MRIYKDGQIYWESTDSNTLEGMIESISNSLYNNHYTKSETMSLIASSRAVVQVATMPSSPTRSTLYYVGTSSPYNVKLVDSNGTIVDLGSSEVDLTDYLKKSDIATSFSASSTNDKVAGAKAIFDYVNSQSYYLYKGKRASSSLNLADCLFNFDSEIGATQNPTTQIICSKMFPYVNMVSPISNSIIEGQLEVVEKVYKSATQYNIYVEETFTRNQGGNKEAFEIYKRKGWASNIDIADLTTGLVTAINTNLTWKGWFPVEYPSTVLTLKNSCTGNASFSVNGGILCLIINVTPSVTARCNFATLPLLPLNAPVNCGSIAINNTGTASTLVWASVNSSGINVDLFSPTTLDRYFGQMVLPLGY